MATKPIRTAVLAAAVLHAACGAAPQPERTVDAVIPEAGLEAGHAGAHAAWSYSGAHGPMEWGVLDEAYAACGVGAEQSPVDLAGAVAADLPPLRVAYMAGPGVLTHNGHTLQVSVADGSVLQVGGVEYRLIQYHHHAPSEHRVGGVPAPLEIHLVHQAADGALAVLGVLFDQGAAGSGVDVLLDPSVMSAGDAVPVAADPRELLPADLSAYFTYDGSLTTPPCTEGVRWFVLRDRGSASAAQLTLLAHAAGANARPVQPLGTRVLQGAVVAPSP